MAAWRFADGILFGPLDENPVHVAPSAAAAPFSLLFAPLPRRGVVPAELVKFAEAPFQVVEFPARLRRPLAQLAHDFPALLQDSAPVRFAS